MAAGDEGGARTSRLIVRIIGVEAYNRRPPATLFPVVSAAARRRAITFLAAAMSAPPTGT
jgi:hypothetical protein